MPAGLSWEASQKYFGLDPFMCLMAWALGETRLPERHGGPLIADEKDYEELFPRLYSEKHLNAMLAIALSLKEQHERGEIIVRLWIDGFFCYARWLLGIQEHLFAFYDKPGLIHRINRDVTRYNLHLLDELFLILTPDMVGIAEDMSYNHGPMISHDIYEEFLLPYYKTVVPVINTRGVKVFIDSDGDVNKMIPWLMEAGIDGIYPLERQAGVDVMGLRKEYPRLLMMGGFDKMVMWKGEAAMRTEFERLLPVMKSGGYVPCVDHQTPPQVSLDDYKLYLRLLKEYCSLAA